MCSGWPEAKQTAVSPPRPFSLAPVTTTALIVSPGISPRESGEMPECKLTCFALRPVAELLHDIRPSVFSSPGGHLDFLEK